MVQPDAIFCQLKELYQVNGTPFAAVSLFLLFLFYKELHKPFILTKILQDPTYKFWFCFQILNSLDMIYAVPKLQQDLFNVLVRFQRNPVGIACDIKEMYLQIEIEERERSHFRLLWRNLDPSQEPDIFEFSRVVFGKNSASMESQFVVQENAPRNQDRYPLAAETVLNRPSEMPEMKASKRKEDANASATLLSYSLQKEAAPKRSNTCEVWRLDPKRCNNSNV